MNANPELTVANALKAGASTAGTPRVPFAANQDKRVSWFSSYNEEWASFVASSSIKKKTTPGIGAEGETLPRVWNAPHG